MGFSVILLNDDQVSLFWRANPHLLSLLGLLLPVRLHLSVKLNRDNALFWLMKRSNPCVFLWVLSLPLSVPIKLEIRSGGEMVCWHLGRIGFCILTSHQKVVASIWSFALSFFLTLTRYVQFRSTSPIGSGWIVFEPGLMLGSLLVATRRNYTKMLKMTTSLENVCIGDCMSAGRTFWTSSVFVTG